MESIENVIIVGSGPAGYTAALYTSRANLNPLVIEGWMWGGLLQQTTDVENYPGFPKGIMGPELMQSFRDQAERFGTRFITDLATKIEPGADGEPHTVWVGDDVYKARTLILSMGAEHKKLGVKGEDELSGRGVSYCATCDAAFFKDRATIIVGGGDSAMEEAIFLSKFASKVVVVNRRNEFRASKIMLERAKAQDNIEFLTPYGVAAFEAGEDGKALTRARLVNLETDEERVLPMDGAFIAIGHEPQSEIAQGIVDIDDEGYVVTDGKSTRTNVAGIFAAGDLVDHTYRQAITAAGSGCQAALDAEWYLRDNPQVPTPEALEGAGDLAEAQWAPGGTFGLVGAASGGRAPPADAASGACAVSGACAPPANSWLGTGTGYLRPRPGRAVPVHPLHAARTHVPSADPRSAPTSRFSDVGSVCWRSAPSIAPTSGRGCDRGRYSHSHRTHVTKQRRGCARRHAVRPRLGRARGRTPRPYPAMP